MNGIVFNEELNKNVVDFDLCNYRIDQVVLSLNNNTYINAPTDITSDVIFTVLPVDDSKDLIQKLELSGDQNCYYLRSYDGVNKVWNGWQTPQGQGGGGTAGANKLVVNSSDSTITQNGSSSYNPTTNTLTINLSANLAGYATQTWVQSQNYLTASALTGYATQTWVQNQGYITNSALNGYATQTWVNQQNFLKSAIQQITIGSNTVTGNVLFAGAGVSYNPDTNTFTFAGGSGSNISITTPDGKTLTNSSFTFKNGSNMNIVSNEATNEITFNSTSSGGSSNTFTIMASAVSRVLGGTGGAIAMPTQYVGSPVVEVFNFTTGSQFSVNIGNITGITNTSKVKVDLKAPILAAQTLSAAQAIKLDYTIFALANNTLIQIGSGSTNTATINNDGTTALLTFSSTATLVGYTSSQLIIAFTASTASATQGNYGIPVFDFSITLS